MASNTFSFACVFAFFQTLWFNFLGLFGNKWSVNNQPNDIEAAIASSAPSPQLESTEPQKVLPTNNLVTVTDTVASFIPQNGPDDRKIQQTVQCTIEDSEIVNDSHQKYVGYDHPSRRPSRRQSSVDPVKARILDETLRHVHDMTLDVRKTVVITSGTVFPVECSAKVEYYHGPMADPCSAKVEHYSTPVVEACSAQVEYLSGPIIPEACSVQVEYYDGVSKSGSGMDTRDISSVTLVEESSPPCFEESTVVVDVEDSHARGGADEGDVDISSEIEAYIAKLQGTLESFKAPPGLPKQPSLTSDPSTPRLKKKHRVQFAMYSEEVPFTPVPERTSRRHRERRQKKRNDLFDVLAQFPDIPAFVPTCPPGRISPGAMIPEEVSEKYAYRTTSRRSISSSESDASKSSYGNSFSEDSESASAPATPDSEYGNRSYSAVPVSRGKLGIFRGTESDGSGAVSPRSYTYF